MIPKRPLLTTLLAACFVVAGSLAAANPQVSDPIRTIRERYSSINKSLARYKKVKKDLSGFSAEGGELFAYSDGPSIMKIAATYYGEMGRSTEDYYYWNGQLIFVFRKELNYDQPLSGKVVSTQENRFYFNNEKLIKWIGENGEDIAPGKTEYVEKQNEYLKSSRQFIKGSRSRKATIEATD